VVWWLFSLVIIITYASIVSHWFDQTSSQTYSSVQDLLEDPALDFGVIQSGSTSLFLQNAKREDLQKVWWRIQRGTGQRNYQPTVSEGIQEVKRSMNGKYAFITEEINLNQAMVEDCSMGLVSGIDSKSFAIAMSKGTLTLQICCIVSIVF
jgi:hypothetical protein